MECHERKIQNRDWCVFCVNVNEQMNMLKKEIQIFVFFLLSVICLKKKRQKQQQRYIVTLHAWLGKQLDFNNRESPPFKAAFLSTWCTKFCMTLHFDFFSFLLFFLFVPPIVLFTFSNNMRHPKYSLISCQSLISSFILSHALTPSTQRCQFAEIFTTENDTLC